MAKETLKKVTDWLESEDQDINTGALLLLQLNRNQILYRNIMHKKLIDKLRYELNKHRELLEARLNHGDFQKLSKKEKIKLEDNKVAALQSLSAQEDETTRKGQRADHSQLTEDVRQAFERNAEIYPRMRATHEKLKLMNTDEYTDCDRYPFVKQLGELDAELRANWDLYDKALPIDPSQTDKAASNNGAEQHVPMAANEVSNARKYLSDNKANLAKHKESGDEKKYNSLLERMQLRLTDLLKDGQGMDEQHLQELIDLGLVKPE